MSLRLGPPGARSARAAVAFLALALLHDADPAPARAARSGTDLYTVDAPGKPWRALPALETAGQLSWAASGPGGARALLRVGYVGVSSADSAKALESLLAREKSGIRDDVDGRSGVERSSFESVSIPGASAGAGGLRWQGFRVSVNLRGKSSTSWRWAALHPRFPAVRRAFTLFYDETAPSGIQAPARVADARALAASVVPAGRGLAGPLEEAWLDSRAAAFAARIDSAQRLCWTHRPDGGSDREHVGYGRGLALEGDFYVLSSSVPADSLVDPAPAEYGAAFDRNGDGRLDLLVVNRGLQPFAGRVREPTVAIYADDDFNGRIDALVLEDLDRDDDHHVDARLFARDTDGDGRIDEARAFGAAAGRDSRKLPLEGGRVRVNRMDVASEMSDFVDILRAATQRLAELDRARAACPHP